MSRLVQLAFATFTTLTLCASHLAYAQEVEPESDIKVLFDGESLEHWIGDSKFWRVENGEIVGETTEDNRPDKNTFLVHQDGDFDDFDLTFKYQVTGYNSGIQYRSEDMGGYIVKGYQADFEAQCHKSEHGNIDKYSGMFFEENGRKFMAQRGQAVIIRSNVDNPKKPAIEVVGSLGDPIALEKAIHRDDWNEMRVIARGYTFTHIINGRVMSFSMDEDIAVRKASGKFAFQLHSGPPMKIRIKDVQVRELN